MNLKNYEVFHDGEYKKLSKVFSEESFRSLPLWSGRISTGLLGLPNCIAGNRGTKNYQEILLASGDDGLRKLVDLGFISCPVCKPEETENFWQDVKENVGGKYGLFSLANFVDKNVLGFDVRRLNFEEILSVVDAVPGRFYLPRDLSNQEVKQFAERIESSGFAVPSLGYYDKTAEGNFFRYSV